MRRLAVCATTLLKSDQTSFRISSTYRTGYSESAVPHYDLRDCLQQGQTEMAYASSSYKYWLVVLALN
jgi:hypothetical protein